MLKASAFPKPDRAWVVLGLMLAASAFVYMPGLFGGFIYDDSTFIVGNGAVHVTTNASSDWAAAAFSFPGGAHQGRWLGMLSFAVNHYFSGLDPYWFKLTNLSIHLLNGILVFLALRALFAWYWDCRSSDGPPTFDGPMAAAAIAGLWLVLPINLTGVLYVSQRLEALSNTFVFLGLWLYLRARAIHWQGRGGTMRLWLSLFACTGIGVLVKESAILLPLYAGCTEWLLGHGRNADGKRSRTIQTLYAVVLILPTIAGLIWLTSWVFGPAAYARSFDTWERLLTETRVLVGYIGWTFAPSLDSLTLYHDDITGSGSVHELPATIASILCLTALMIVALWQRQRRPLFSIGVFWFFCGHLLTATIIPLLLAFEHRNYFPSVGLLLAGASLVALEGGLKRFVPRMSVFLMIAAFYAFTTWMRAQEWSDPMRLVISEASKRPKSPLAQYDKAATLIKAGATQGQSVVEDGLRVLDEKRNLRGAGISFEQALIMLNTNAGRPVNPDWYASILLKLRTDPPSLQDARALQFLNECFADGSCKQDISFLDDAYAAAMAWPRPSGILFYVHSQYEAFLKGNYAQAEEDLRKTVAMSPFDPDAREALVTVLIHNNRRAEAENVVEQMKSINRFGFFDQAIQKVELQLKNGR